jgi:hypothetical protein
MAPFDFKELKSGASSISKRADAFRHSAMNTTDNVGSRLTKATGLTSAAQPGKVSYLRTQQDFDALCSKPGTFVIFVYSGSFLNKPIGKTSELDVPTFETLASEWPDVWFGKMEVDKSRAVAQQQGFTAPSCVIFQDGNSIETVSASCGLSTRCHSLPFW